MSSRPRILLGGLFVLFVSTLGPAMKSAQWSYPMTDLWPVAGLWAAIAWSGGYMSVRAAATLVLIGLYQDFLHEAPLGAWALAFLLTYALGISAHRMFPSRRDFMLAMTAGLVVGLLAALIGLMISAGITDSQAVISRTLLANLVLTGMFYYLVRPLLVVNARLEEAV